MGSTSHRNPQPALCLLFFGMLIVLAVTHAGWAQTTKGTIFGTVTDTTGAVVPGVNVKLIATGTNATREVTTGADGSYVVPLLVPGKYQMRAEKQGFTPRVIEAVELLVDARQQLDFKLSVAGALQEVTVTAGAPLVETGSAAVGQVINEKTITNMPLNGRNFLQLVLLSAGAVPLGPVSDAASFGRPSVNISGGREASNQFTIDGVFNNAVHFEGLNLQPNIDTIQEFKVQRNTFAAEFGHGTAVVNVVTKGGTNNIHFTVYEFLRNNVLDAKQYFDTKTPPFRQNQFGGVISGPIIKNKTFFLFSYEGFRMRRNITVRGTMPTSQMLSGVFPTPIVDPLTHAPFPGNTIPSSRFSTISKAMLPFLPKVSTAGALNYVTAPSFSNDSNQYSIRLDHRFSDRDTIFARYTWADTSVYSPGLISHTGTEVSDVPVNGGVQWTHAFRPELLNEVLLGFNRNLQDRLQDGANDPSLNVLATMQNIVTKPENFGIPTVQWSGYSTFGTPLTYPEVVGGNTLQVDDSLTWVKGRHTLKLGGGVRNLQFPHTPYVGSRGQFVFLGVVTGNPVADFLLGTPLVFLGAGKGPSAYLSTKSFSFFGQDDWRVSSTFTLNYGLRYDRFSPLSDRTRGRLGVYDKRDGTVVPPSQVEAKGLVIPDNNNFGPRVGFSWNMFGDEKTVLRGGYGLYYDVKPVNEYNFSLGTELAFQQILNLPALTGGTPLTWDGQFPASPGTGLGILSDDPFARTPMVQSWSLGMQRALPKDMVFEMLYAGSAGRKLNRRIEANQRSTAGGTVTATRPNPNLQSIALVSDRAYSNYDSLQARLEKRWTKNLYLLSVYTWSHSRDTSSNNPEMPQNSFAPESAEYGNSYFDQRHRFVFSSGWMLPFGKGQRWSSSNNAVNYIVGGWQFNSIVTISSGNPFTVSAPGDRTNSGVFGGGVQRANYTGQGDGILPASDRSVQRWFNTAAFVAAPMNTFGNVGRNTLVGPGTQNFDLALFKIFDLSERAKLEFRSEFFNAFNKAQFNIPVSDPTSPAFGQIISVRNAREIQFGLKLRY
jgi:outer membrane receptor protein involved in Fe transport